MPARRTHSQEPGTLYHDLDDVSVPELGGSRPDWLFAVSGPQERVQRHTVEQMADSAPVLPMLDAPVPLMVEQPVQVLKFLDISLPDAEQVIEVPKIFSEDSPSRSSVSEPQLADQLVEVPTNRVYALAVVAVRTVGWEAAAALSRRRGGLQDLRPDQPEGDTARPGRDTNTGRRDDGMADVAVLWPLVFGSHLFGASPDEYMSWIFWELTSGIISVCSALGSTVDTSSASVYGCF